MSDTENYVSAGAVLVECRCGEEHWVDIGDETECDNCELRIVIPSNES